MNLREFSNKYIKKTADDIKENVKKLEEEIKKENIEEFEEVKTMYDKYSSMNQSELEKELFEQINLQKQNGTFDANNIKQTYETLKPMLNEAQRERLEHYIKMIL